MSAEVWGDDDADAYDHLLEAGWMDDTQTGEIREAIKSLRDEMVYEGGKKENGVSVRFLARITMLEVFAGMRVTSDPLAQEAAQMLFPDDARWEGPAHG